MNTRERFVKTLTGKKVDRVPFIKVFGGANAIHPKWEKEHPRIGECIDEKIVSALAIYHSFKNTDNEYLNDSASWLAIHDLETHVYINQQAIEKVKELISQMELAELNAKVSELD